MVFVLMQKGVLPTYDLLMSKYQKYWFTKRLSTEGLMISDIVGLRYPNIKRWLHLTRDVCKIYIGFSFIILIVGIFSQVFGI